MKKIEYIVIHHTASNRDRTTIKDIENWHKARWSHFVSSLGYHIGYHYVILGNGQLVQTRKDYELGAHTIPNDGKIGVSLCGNFDIEKPSHAQLRALSRLLDDLKRKHNLNNNRIQGHYYFSRTACPGRNLIQWIKDYKKRDLGEIQKMIFEIMEKIKIISLLIRQLKGQNKNNK